MEECGKHCVKRRKLYSLLVDAWMTLYILFIGTVIIAFMVFRFTTTVSISMFVDTLMT